LNAGAQHKIDVKGGRLPPWVKDIERYIQHGMRQKILSGELRIHAEGKLGEFIHDAYDGLQPDAGATSAATSIARVLIGSKGTGKTICLVWKAAIVSNLDSILQIPNVHPYHCRLGSRTIVLDPAARPDFLAHATWHTLWKALLMVLFVVRQELSAGTAGQSPAAVENEYDNVEREVFSLARETLRGENHGHRADPISPLVVRLIGANWALRDYGRLYSKAYARLSDGTIARDGRPVVLIMDALDESLSESVAQGIRSEDGRTVWLAAQSGLIDAIYELESASSGKFLCYAGVRHEAYHFYAKHGNKSLSQIDEEFALKLVDQYDRASMDDIFAINVERMKMATAPLFSGDAPTQQFFGTTAYKHLYVYGQTEHPIDWLWRHTFARPRELVWHGQELADKARDSRGIQKAAIDRASVSRIINQVAYAIYKDYRDRMVPSWDGCIDEGLSVFDRNILLSSERTQIEKKFASAPGRSPSNELEQVGLITYLYRRGLIGYPRPRRQMSSEKVSGHALPCEQVFEQPGTSTLTESLPVASYYILHPCFSEAVIRHVKTRQESDFFTRRFVVGAGLGCPEDYPAPRVQLRRDQHSGLLEVWLRHPGAQGNDLSHVSDLSDRESDTRTLFVCIAVAMFKDHMQQVSIERLSAIAEELRIERLVSSYMGEKKLQELQELDGTVPVLDKAGMAVTQGHTERYILNCMDYESSNVPSAVRQFPTSIGSTFQIGLDTRHSTHTSLRTYSLRGVTPSEIEIII